MSLANDDDDERVLHIVLRRTTPYGVTERHIYSLCFSEDQATRIKDEEFSNIPYLLPGWKENIARYGIHRLGTYLSDGLCADGMELDQVVTGPVSDYNREWCLEDHAIVVDE